MIVPKGCTTGEQFLVRRQAFATLIAARHFSGIGVFVEEKIPAIPLIRCRDAEAGFGQPAGKCAVNPDQGKCCPPTRIVVKLNWVGEPRAVQIKPVAKCPMMWARTAQRRSVLLDDTGL